MKKIFIVCIFCIIIIPLLKFNTQSNYFSDLDNSILMDFSEISSFSDLESYMEKRLGARRYMIWAYDNANHAIFGEYGDAEEEIGKNGQEFAKFSDVNGYSEYIDTFADFIIGMSNYFDNRGVDFYFEFDPQKSIILTEYLPEGYSPDDSWVSTFINKLENNGVNVVDNYSYLQTKKDEYQLFNIKYDAVHWNETGAILGTNNLLSSLKNKYDYIELYNLDSLEYEDVFIKYNLNSVKEINETIRNYSIGTYYVDSTDIYRWNIDISETFNDFLVWDNNNESKANLLMFQGSYYFSNNRSKFIANQFNRYVAVHNYRNVENYEYYYNIFKPDVVVFEATDYTFKDYFFNYEIMSKKEVIPSYDADRECKNEKMNNTIKEYINGTLLNIDISLKEPCDYVYIVMDSDFYDCRKLTENLYECTLESTAYDSAKNVLIIYDIDGNYYSQVLK